MRAPIDIKGSDRSGTSVIIPILCSRVSQQGDSPSSLKPRSVVWFSKQFIWSTRNIELGIYLGQSMYDLRLYNAFYFEIFRRFILATIFDYSRVIYS